MQMVEQELQDELMCYGEFILNHKEKECDWEEYKSPHEIVSKVVCHLEDLTKKIQAYSNLLTAVRDAILDGGNDAAIYVKAIEYLDDEIFIFQGDLEALFKEADEEKKNL